MAHGGKRAGAGFKAKDGATGVIKCHVGLTEDMWAFIDEHEGDSVSEKLRNVLRAAMGDKPRRPAKKKARIPTLEEFKQQYMREHELNTLKVNIELKVERMYKDRYCS